MHVTETDQQQLCLLPAVEMRRLLRSGELSARELVQAHLDRIDSINPAINATVTLTDEAALRRAYEADRAHVRGHTLGPLHEIPVAHKDLQVTRGVRTTFGSALHADHVPAVDSVVVTRMADAGAISVGKTNTPEFGTGSQIPTTRCSERRATLMI